MILRERLPPAGGVKPCPLITRVAPPRMDAVWPPVVWFVILVIVGVTSVIWSGRGPVAVGVVVSGVDTEWPVASLTVTSMNAGTTPFLARSAKADSSGAFRLK